MNIIIITYKEHISMLVHGKFISLPHHKTYFTRFKIVCYVPNHSNLNNLSTMTHLEYQFKIEKYPYDFFAEKIPMLLPICCFGGVECRRIAYTYHWKLLFYM